MVAAVLPLPTTPSGRLPADPADRAALARQEARYDATLVQKFVAGDEAAFVEIVTRYRKRMFQVAFGLLRNRADAEEIAQDTFIRAHRGLANFRGESSLAAWLYCITLNLSRNRYWYFFRRRRHFSMSLDAPPNIDGATSIADLVASEAPSPVREAVNNEFSAVIASCMERLPPRQREILQLRNVQQHSYAHIGRLLGLRIGTVKSRVARSRRSLRTLLAQAYPESRPAVSAFHCLESLRCPSPGRRETACA